MKVRTYSLITVLLLGVSIVTLFFRGFSLLHFLDALFMFSLFTLCIGLFLHMFSDGAFSIMGHSFRRFHYVMAPERMKETMKDDELYTSKEVKIRQEKYSVTLPLIVTSLICFIISLIASYLII